MNEKVRGWKPSLKQQGCPLEITKTKEKMKRKVKIESLVWDDFVLQEKLKYLMYVNHSLRRDPMKEYLID